MEEYYPVVIHPIIIKINCMEKKYLFDYNIFNIMLFLMFDQPLNIIVKHSCFDLQVIWPFEYLSIPVHNL